MAADLSLNENPDANAGASDKVMSGSIEDNKALKSMSLMAKLTLNTALIDSGTAPQTCDLIKACWPFAFVYQHLF